MAQGQKLLNRYMSCPMFAMSERGLYASCAEHSLVRSGPAVCQLERLGRR